MRSRWEADGYLLVSGLFSEAEVDALTERFMALRAEPCPLDDQPLDLSSPDPLRHFPRIMHPHRWDDAALAFLIDQRIQSVFDSILDEEMAGVQTMIYFKPPGARGQALHQDQFYLRVQPGTCVAAWLALDDCDEENGCMSVVPGSQTLPVLCPIPADTAQSFTDITVPLPPGSEPVACLMKRGDVLFFNGSLIHGSGPNVSSDRFRRALIGHYAPANSASISQFYGDAWGFDGRQIEMNKSDGGGPCGRFTETGIEMIEAVGGATRAH